MPLFARDYDGFGSTQDYVRKVLALAMQTPFTTHLEIETYTWDVLPPGLKLDLASRSPGSTIGCSRRWERPTRAQRDTRSPDTRSADTRSSNK